MIAAAVLTLPRVKMASKAYVASMTVAELKAELNKRGMNTRGRKSELQDRLEMVGKQFFGVDFLNHKVIVP